MQRQPFDRSGQQGIRPRPAVFVIVAAVVVFALGLGVVGVLYRPLLARYHYSRGYTWNQQREFDKAIAEYSTAIRLDPGYADAYFGRGFAWNEKKQLDKAIADYTEVIRLQPKNAHAYDNRGSVHHTKKDYDMAIADYNKAIRIDHKDPHAYLGRGYALSKKKEWNKALADYNEAIALDPKDAFPHIYAAWILTNCPDERIRDGKRAVESATKACELSAWKEPQYLDMLAAAYAATDDFASAVKWQRKANALHSDPELKAQGEARLNRFQRTSSFVQPKPQSLHFKREYDRGKVCLPYGDDPRSTAMYPVTEPTAPATPVA